MAESPINRDDTWLGPICQVVGPSRSIDGIVVGAGRRGPVTERLQAELFGIAGGQISDRHGWLTLID